MSRKLQFHIDELVVEGEMDKLTRDALYGWSDIEAFDENGNLCELVSVADDGQTLFGEGGYTFANLNSHGDFVDSKNLVAVDEENIPIKSFESSFNTGIPLVETVDSRELLSHQVKSVYQINFAENNQLVDELLKGTIFKFPFSYRNGISEDVGFLLTNFEDDVFLLTTIPSDLTFLSFENTSALDEGDESDSDIFDFGDL